MDQREVDLQQRFSTLIEEDYDYSIALSIRDVESAPDLKELGFEDGLKEEG